MKITMTANRKIKILKCPVSYVVLIKPWRIMNYELIFDLQLGSYIIEMFNIYERTQNS